MSTNRSSATSSVKVHRTEPLQKTRSITVKLFVGKDGLPEIRDITVRQPTEFDHLVLFSSNVVTKYHARAIGRAIDLRGVARNARNVLDNISNSLQNPVPLSGYYFDTRCCDPNNIAHIMMTIAPACLKVRSILGPDVKFVFRPMKQIFVDLLHELSINPVISRRALCGRRVDLRVIRILSQNDVLNVYDSPPIVWLDNTMEQFNIRQIEGYDKIYLARQDARSITNSAALEVILKERGYTTVYMENFSITRQMEIAASARHVVAVHGAAMGFLALNRSLESVIEILPPNVYHEFFPLSIGSRVSKYIQILPSFDIMVACEGWDAILAHKSRPFVLAPQLLDLALGSI